MVNIIFIMATSVITDYISERISKNPKNDHHGIKDLALNAAKRLIKR